MLLIFKTENHKITILIEIKWDAEGQHSKDEARGLYQLADQWSTFKSSQPDALHFYITKNKYHCKG